MSIFEFLLLASFIALPCYEWINAGKTKQGVVTGETTKVKVYQQTILMLILPTILLAMHVATSELTLVDIGIVVDFGRAQLIGFSLLAIVLVYFVVSLKQVQQNPDVQQKTLAQMAHLAWIMPSDKRELAWFSGAVSVTAGICEELLFRGFFLTYFDDVVGLPAAVLISSTLFGLCHLYQGWQNAIRTGLVGLILSMIYLSSGSLLLVIILHFALDAYAGGLYYLCKNGVKKQSAVLDMQSTIK